MDKRPVNFSQKGFSANFLSFMKRLEKNDLCCLDFLTQVYTQDSDSVTFSGLGTQASPLIATSISQSLTANNGVIIDSEVIQLGQSIGEAGSPASLLNNREIPLNGNALTILTTYESLVTGFYDGSDDYFYTTSTSPTFIRHRIDNYSNDQNAGCGMLMINDLFHNGFFYMASSNNHFIQDGLAIVSNATAGGIAFVATAGAIKFGNQQSQPYTAGEYARFSLTGQLGLGVQTTSANLHIKASSGAAGTAPIKLNPGVLMSTPQNGAIETDGTHLYWTDSAGTRHTIV